MFRDTKKDQASVEQKAPPFVHVVDGHAKTWTRPLKISASGLQIKNFEKFVYHFAQLASSLLYCLLDTKKNNLEISRIELETFSIGDIAS